MKICAYEPCRQEFRPRGRQIYCSPSCKGKNARRSPAGVSWRVNNRDKLNASARRWGEKNRHKLRGYNRTQRLRKRGLTEETFQQMLDAQGGRCAICRTDDPGKKDWRVDHDHSTGKTRGLLCGPCNGALGFVEKPGWLDAARRYLNG